MNEQVKLFLRNKGIELSSFVVNTIFVIGSVVYGITMLLAFMLTLQLFEADFVREAWMNIPYAVGAISLIAWSIYGLHGAYTSSYQDWRGTFMLVLEFVVGIGIVIAIFAAGIYLILGFVGYTVLLLSGIIQPQMIIPITVFQVSAIGATLYGVPKWLMLNWDKSKRGEKSYFKPLWRSF